jgi:hypothetical protein
MSDSILLLAQQQTTMNPVLKSESFELVVNAMSEAAEAASNRAPAVVEADAVAAEEEAQEDPANESVWQARCIELEDSLQKFREQASNIRELLREKVRDKTKNYVMFCLLGVSLNWVTLSSR